MSEMLSEVVNSARRGSCSGYCIKSGKCYASVNPTQLDCRLHIGSSLVSFQLVGRDVVNPSTLELNVSCAGKDSGVRVLLWSQEFHHVCLVVAVWSVDS